MNQSSATVGRQGFPGVLGCVQAGGVGVCSHRASRGGGRGH